MSLALGNRQLAMLREMGIRVWQPAAVPATGHSQAGSVPASAINTEAARAHNQGSSTDIHSQKQPAHTRFAAPAAAGPAAPAVPVVPAAPAARSVPQDAASTGSGWQLGAVQSLYAQASAAPGAPRWLVLLEAPASALQAPFDAFAGDAGLLLDNMLRATGMHTRGAVQLAPLVRGNGAAQALPASFFDVLATTPADVVLVMGRLAAQAVLQSAEPLARLRGQVHRQAHEHEHEHDVNGGQRLFRTIVTLDPAYLLRNPLDKAKAWDDLCLALSVSPALAEPDSA